MKESEAIRHLERHHEFLRNAWKPHPDHECLDSICMAIAALRKQVPQKPKHELIKYGRHSWEKKQIRKYRRDGMGKRFSQWSDLRELRKNRMYSLRTRL